MPLQNVSLLVFDMDGVFRDSTKVVTEGFRRAFESEGFDFGIEEREAHFLLGLGKYNDRNRCLLALLSLLRSKTDLKEIIYKIDAEAIIDQVVAKHSSDDDASILERLQNVYYSFINSDDAKRLMKIYPNSEAHMELLKKKGYKVAIFSNASIRSIKRDIPYLEKFDEVASIETVKNKKPSGEGILLVAKSLGINLSNTAYVGDTIVDIQAAKDAGCKSIVLLEGGMGIIAHLEAEKPDLMFKNLADLAKHLTGR